MSKRGMPPLRHPHCPKCDELIFGWSSVDPHKDWPEDLKKELLAEGNEKQLPYKCECGWYGLTREAVWKSRPSRKRY